MIRFRLSTFVLGLIVPAVACAQISISTGPAGQAVTLPGAPFQAERMTRTVSHLGDGSTVTREDHEILSRDADGRFLDRSKLDSGPGSTAEHVTVFFLADPVGHRLLEWSEGAKTAIDYPLINMPNLNITALQLPHAKEPKTPDAKKVTKTEDLGTRTIAGLKTTGQRTVTTLPAGTIGNENALVWKHDVWTSADLHMVVAEDEENPFFGTRHVETTSVKLVAPDAALFVLPAGLGVKDLPVPNIESAKAKMVYEQMLKEMANPDVRDQMAVRLISYAKTHPEVENRVAKELAVRDTHLDEAAALEQEAIGRLERDSAAVSGSAILPTDLRRMQQLALCWDTMGWVLAARGDLAGARIYYQDAWQLSGEGLYMSHIARLDEQAGDKTAAAHHLQIALSGRLDAEEQQRISKTLARLGVDAPQPITEPTDVPIARAGNAMGESQLYLIFVRNQPPRVRWMDDKPVLQAETPALRDAKYPVQAPVDSQAYIIRAARLTCTAQTCTAHLLYAWEAIQMAGSPHSVNLGTK